MTTVETVIQKAIERYGADLQKQVAIEEMAELTKEICKDFRGKGNREHILEEIADVKIMLSQLLIMYDIKVWELNDVIVSKLTRLEERLKGE
jgi:NTP pyrophosphatase (non-canonical NTP hydrolase)